MTGEERDITGASDATELRTMRDALTDVARSMAELAGRFKEHADTEEHWQDRVDDWMRAEPERIAKGAAVAVAACREDAEPEVREALNFFKRQEGAQLERRAVRHFFNDVTRRGLVVLVTVVLACVTVLLLLDEADLAAQVTAVLTIATPFLLLIWQRKH